MSRIPVRWCSSASRLCNNRRRPRCRLCRRMGCKNKRALRVNRAETLGIWVKVGECESFVIGLGQVWMCVCVTVFLSVCHGLGHLDMCNRYAYESAVEMCCGVPVAGVGSANVSFSDVCLRFGRAIGRITLDTIRSISLRR